MSTTALSARAEAVLDVIRRAGPGTPESELVYRTGLQGTALVEALIELEAEGLIMPTHWGPR